jgi:hypothetical protein
MAQDILSIELPEPEALSYFLTEIDWEGKALPPRVLGNGMLEDGCLYAIAPKGTSGERLLRFRTGGLIPPTQEKIHVSGMRLVPIPSLSKELVSIIRNFSASDAGLNVFIREPLLTLRDKSPLVAGLRENEGVLFNAFALQTYDDANLEAEIRRRNVIWSFLLLLSGASCDTSSIKAIISSASFIAVNAYDGESYLYWVRKGTAAHLP